MSSSAFCSRKRQTATWHGSHQAGNFFKVPEGYSKTKATDQAIRFVDRMADYAEMYDVLVALEPTKVILGSINVK
jgi:hypothetical protein